MTVSIIFSSEPEGDGVKVTIHYRIQEKMVEVWYVDKRLKLNGHNSGAKTP